MSRKDNLLGNEVVQLAAIDCSEAILICRELQTRAPVISQLPFGLVGTTKQKRHMIKGISVDMPTISLNHFAHDRPPVVFVDILCSYMNPRPFPGFQNFMQALTFLESRGSDRGRDEYPSVSFCCRLDPRSPCSSGRS